MLGSACGCASTLEMTGILGVLISVAASAASNLETAGSMKLVWNAPATARRTYNVMVQPLPLSSNRTEIFNFRIQVSL